MRKINRIATRLNSPMYNLLWIVDGETKEYLLRNVSYLKCLHEAEKLKKRNAKYKEGLLQPRKVNNY